MMSRTSGVIWVLFVSCMVFVSLPAMSVSACSGAPWSPTLEQLEERSEIIVEAVPIELDDEGQNVIVSVERYIKGDGPSHLLITRLPPALIHKLTYTDPSCYVSLRTPMTRGIPYIFSLERNINGSYRILMDFAFPQPDATIALRTNSNDYENYTDYTRDELATQLNEPSGEPIVTPPFDYNFPRKRPIQITTQSGQNYIFPIDNGTPQPLETDLHIEYDLSLKLDEVCKAEDCLVFSPDSIALAIIGDDNTIYFAYRYSDWEIDVDLPEPAFSGNAVVFSPRSDRAVIWDHDQLSVLSLSSETIDKSIALAITDDSDFSGNGLWISDNLFAYVDAEGLWLWEMYYTDHRELIMPADGDSMNLEQVTPNGRYLIYRTNKNEDYPYDVLDLLTREHFSIRENYRLISGHGDRYLFQWTPVEPFMPDSSRSFVEICVLSAANCIQMDWVYMSETATLEAVIPIQTRSYNFVAKVCEVENDTSCHFETHYIGSILAGGGYGAFEIVKHGEGIDFIWDPDSENTIIVHDDYVIDIDGTTYDLEDSLDSKIVSIEWLPSLFYEQPFTSN